MNFNEYQTAATEFSRYPSFPRIPGMYTILGLCGESGEVAEKLKKYIRDGGDYNTVREDIKKELGDVLWYLSQTAREWELSLQDVAEANISKLSSRQQRGVLQGSGDNR